MKAVVCTGTRIEAPTDILLRVTSAAICGTDLHIYVGPIAAAAVALS
jgi:threonine dehydrogenase-like Zn-dependent dehydrogenase